MEATDKTSALGMINKLMSEFDIKNKEVIQRGISGKENIGKQTIFILNDIDFVTGKYKDTEISYLSQIRSTNNSLSLDNPNPNTTINETKTLTEPFCISQKNTSGHSFVCLKDYNITLTCSIKAPGNYEYLSDSKIVNIKNMSFPKSDQSYTNIAFLSKIRGNIHGYSEATLNLNVNVYRFLPVISYSL